MAVGLAELGPKQDQRGAHLMSLALVLSRPELKICVLLTYSLLPHHEDCMFLRLRSAPCFNPVCAFSYELR
jgi:hypothetical protein